MLGPIARISNHGGISVMKNIIRNGSHGGIPGESLPFNINSKYRVTWHFTWFIGSGLTAPYLVLLHQLRKK